MNAPAVLQFWAGRGLKVAGAPATVNLAISEGALRSRIAAVRAPCCGGASASIVERMQQARIDLRCKMREAERIGCVLAGKSIAILVAARSAVYAPRDVHGADA